MKNKESIQDLVVRKAKEGKVVFRTIEGLAEMSIDEFIKQPTEGILYDINRDKVVSLTRMKNGDRRAVNDFAVALVIEKLKKLLDI